jgi:hypothetical protein
MPPVQLAFCAWLAEHRRQEPGEPIGVSWRDADTPAFARHYRDVDGTNSVLAAKMQVVVAQGTSKEWFDERKARHNKLVDSALGWRGAPYRVVAVGRRPRTRFRLALPAEAIELSR